MMLLWPDRNDNSRHYLQKRFKDKRSDHAKLHSQALRDTERIVAWLVRSRDPRAVYIFGDIIESNLFDEHSRLRVALEGCRKRGLDKGTEDAGEVIERMSRFPIDLIDLDECAPALGRSIRQTGFKADTACS